MDKIARAEENNSAGMHFYHNFYLNIIFFQERLFGIYLAYMLYFVQPEGFVAQIKVTPAQLIDLKEFIRERIIPERHVDAYIALLKLENVGAFRVVAFEKDVRNSLHAFLFFFFSDLFLISLDSKRRKHL